MLTLGCIKFLAKPGKVAEAGAPGVFVIFHLSTAGQSVLGKTDLPVKAWEAGPGWETAEPTAV